MLTFYPANTFNQVEIINFSKSQKMAIYWTLGLTIIMLILWVSVVTEDNLTKAAHKYVYSCINISPIPVRATPL